MYNQTDGVRLVAKEVTDMRSYKDPMSSFTRCARAFFKELDTALDAGMQSRVGRKFEGWRKKTRDG